MFNYSSDEEVVPSENAGPEVVAVPETPKAEMPEAPVIKVLILTEGGGSLGWGHLTRCLALTQGLEEAGCEWQAVVNTQGSLPSSASGPKWFQGNWQKINESAERPIRVADYVIIDSAVAPEAVYEKIHSLNPNLVVIDDNNRVKFPPCLLVNPNVYGAQMNYPEICDARVGAEYALLRQPFWDASPKTSGPVKSVLIALGGGNFQAVKKDVLKFFVATYPDFKKFVIGCGRERSSDDRKDGDPNTVFFRDIDAKRMRDVMISSDIAMSAGGQTLTELARMGVPAIAFNLVENHDRNVDAWASLGFVQKADAKDMEGSKALIKAFIDQLNQDIDGRMQMVSKAQQMVDGQGVKRLVEELIRKKAERS